MRTIQLLATSLVLVSLLNACGAQGESVARPEPPPVEETAFGELVGTMDKARSVEDTTMQRSQELDEALEKSENP